MTPLRRVSTAIFFDDGASGAQTFNSSDSGVCGWQLALNSATGHKITLTRWATQLLRRQPRFQKVGPLVNEFLIDVFSCIEDQRLAFHSHNRDKRRISLPRSLGMSGVVTSTPNFVDREIENSAVALLT